MTERPQTLHERTAAPQIVIDPILPAAMAVRAEEYGVKRAQTDAVTELVLSVLGGAFVALGAIFATTVSAGTLGDGSVAFSLPYGITRLLIGLAFCLGLILVVIGGAELFTGNNLIVMAWASRKVTTRRMLANWGLVFTGNAVGALGTAVLLFLSTQYTFGNGAVGLVALNTAHAKASLAFVPALVLGILCNALVCLAVWMCYSARTSVDRVVSMVPPIAGFAAAGFEHSIANIYFIPVGLLIKAGAPAAFWESIGRTPADFPALSWENFVANLVPVTLGNIVGGSLMVAAVYWFVYLRGRAS
jgi:formate/nitrite transporter